MQRENLRRWLKEQCQDEAEKMVYQLSFEEELKPGQIVTRHPDHFPDVQDVYRIKLRLYRRIQRSLGWGSNGRFPAKVIRREKKRTAVSTIKRVRPFLFNNSAHLLFTQIRCCLYRLTRPQQAKKVARRGRRPQPAIKKTRPE